MSAPEFLWRHADMILVMGPMLAGLLLTLAPGGRIAAGAAIAVSLAAAVLAATLVVRMLAGAPPVGVDAIGVSAAAVVALIAAATFAAAATLAPRDHPRRSRAIALGLGLLASGAVVGAVLDRDALRIVFHLQTAALVCAALTVMGADRDRRAASAAFSLVLTSLCGGALALGGAAWLHAATGALDLSAVGARVAAHGGDRGAWFGAALMMAGLAALAGLAPLHAGAAANAARIPHALAPLPAILLRAGAFIALVRVYGVTQQILTPGVAQAFAYAAAALGVMSVVAGALQAISATEARRLAAHALTAQFGCALIGLAAGGDDGAIAALFVVAAAAMTTLALIVGAAAARGENVAAAPMAVLDGLGKTRPLVAAAITIAALGLTGAPLTAAFLGKWLSIEAALAQGWYWAAAAIVASSFAAVFVAGQLIERLYFRDRAPALGAPPKGAIAFAPALIASALATLAFGWNAAAPLDAARMAAGALAPMRGAQP